MTDLKEVHLFVVLTRKLGLKDWYDLGLLERETAIYHALLPHLAGITLVSWRGAEDEAFADKIGGLTLLTNKHDLPAARYVTSLPSREDWPASAETVLVKSNQTKGADHALMLAGAAGGKFISRCGYLLGDFAAKDRSRNPLKKLAKWGLARYLEGTVFIGADHCIVTTEDMKSYIHDKFHVDEDRVTVVPNYVDTDLFTPQGPETKTARRIFFVGRLEPQKNLPALFDALAGLDVELVLAGEGGLRGQLEAQAKDLGLKAKFLGRIGNTELPHWIRSSEIFVLPSHFEGHPKSLLEGFACGGATVTTDVPGIAGVAKHGENAFVCSTDAASLRNGIETLLGDAELRDKLSAGARQYVLDTVALSSVAEQEKAVYRTVLTRD